jgi:hypothetical protein
VVQPEKVSIHVASALVDEKDAGNLGYAEFRHRLGNVDDLLPKQWNPPNCGMADKQNEAS